MIPPNVEAAADEPSSMQGAMQGRVSPVLRQLEAERLLESYDGSSDARARRPSAAHDKLTAEGRRVAKQEAAAIAGLLNPALGMA